MSFFPFLYVVDYLEYKKYFKNSSFFSVTKRGIPTCYIEFGLKMQIIRKIFNEKISTMKTLNVKNSDANLDVYALTVEEMICVKGGDADPILKPSLPPVKI